MKKLKLKLYKNLIYCDFFITKKKKNYLSINDYTLYNMHEKMQHIKQFLILIKYVKLKMKEKKIIFQLNSQLLYNFSQMLNTKKTLKLKYIKNNLLNYLKIKNYYKKTALYCQIDPLQTTKGYHIRQNTKLFFSNIELIAYINVTLFSSNNYILPLNINNLKKYLFFYILFKKYNVAKSYL